MPSTLPSADVIPAISSTEPFGLRDTRRRRGQVLPAVGERDLLVLFDVLEGLRGAGEVAFTMGNRAPEFHDAMRPDVLGDRPDRHKPALEPPAPVRHERDIPGICFVKRGHEPEVCKDLETVADPKHQVIAVKELAEVVPEIISHPVRIRVAGAGVVPVGKPAGEDEQPVIRTNAVVLRSGR